MDWLALLSGTATVAGQGVTVNVGGEGAARCCVWRRRTLAGRVDGIGGTYLWDEPDMRRQGASTTQCCLRGEALLGVLGRPQLLHRSSCAVGSPFEIDGVLSHLSKTLANACRQ